jgi:hypothetical protein
MNTSPASNTWPIAARSKSWKCSVPPVWQSVGAAPVAKLVLDRVVHRLVEVAARGLHLRLQADAGADDVIDHHHLRALGVARVAHQRPRAAAQRRQARHELHVGARVRYGAASEAR